MKNEGAQAMLLEQHTRWDFGDALRRLHTLARDSLAAGMNVYMWTST
jgi:hypothetical protein